jgi:hypothetical protein
MKPAMPVTNPAWKSLFWRGGLAVLALSACVAAYGFDLLDPERGKDKTPPLEQPVANPTPAAPPPPPKPAPPQRDFALQGTSRIGNRLIAVLETPEGKALSQELKGGKPTPINGFGEYSLVEVNPRHATLSYPEDAPCQNSNPQRGLRCSDDGKTARLELLRGKPTAPAAPPLPVPVAGAPVPMPFGGQPPQPIPGRPGAPVPGHPMPGLPGTATKPTPQIMNDIRKQEQQRTRQGQPATAAAVPVNPAASGGIKPPGSIRDEDVPPGMRVVRTPFGDTLVPLNQ